MRLKSNQFVRCRQIQGLSLLLKYLSTDLSTEAVENIESQIYDSRTPLKNITCTE
jgi:hypothetical protein